MSGCSRKKPACAFAKVTRGQNLVAHDVRRQSPPKPLLGPRPRLGLSHRSAQALGLRVPNNDRTAHIDTFARDGLPPSDEWPEFRFDLPELQYPDNLNCATVLLDEAVVEGHGDRVALYFDGGTWSYRKLMEQANRIARVLCEDMDLVPGNRVLLRSANNPMLAACWFGVVKAGGIAVTTMPQLRARELRVIAEKARVSHVLSDARLVEECAEAIVDSDVQVSTGTFGDGSFGDGTFGDDSLEAAMAQKSAVFDNVDTAAEDICILAFTSGTTGQPKATVHFHRDVLAMADTFARHVLRTNPDDVYLGSPPLGFTFGLGALLVFPLRFRAAASFLEAPTPDGLLQAVQATGVTCLFTAPTMYRALLPKLAGFDLSTLRKCVSAGEPLPKATSDAWYEATGIRIIDGIGTTEMIHIFISAEGADIRPGATGIPIPGYEACILGPDNQPLPPGSSGRLAVKGPTGCRYLTDERQRDYVVNGWNVTGDVYRLDEDGYFWFEARADDMIISAGYNIAGPEVEAALLEHPGVAECAVVASPHAERGNIAKAFVVRASGFETAGEEFALELQNLVKTSIAPYKYPREIEWTDSLPKTQTGKVQRFKLREMERRAADGDRGRTD